MGSVGMRSYWGIVAVWAVVGISGCSQSSSLDGKASFQGVPIKEGWISLEPVDGKGPVAGAPITEGVFEVKGLVPGKKIVKINSVQDVKWVASSEEYAKMAETQKLSSRTDVVFAADQVTEDTEGNYQELEILPGKQTKDFALQPAGAPDGTAKP